MKTTQGWGWLAAGVLALGLNGIYHDGGAAWAHRNLDGVMARIASRSEAVIALASGRADRFVTNTSLATARNETASCRLATAVARVQTRIARTQSGFAHFEAMSARQEAALARVEASRARLEGQIGRVRLATAGLDSVELPVVACPRVRVNIPRVTVPRAPTVRIQAPVVQVDLGGGPI